EEERRLMYVALTRAKDKLYLLHAKSRMLYGEAQANPPSQFLKDIPEHLLDKDEVPVPSFGVGIRPIPQEAGSYSFSASSSGSGWQSASATPAPAKSNGPEFQDGDKVFHQSFGEGTIISVKGGVATICFKAKKHGIKKLALSIAPLEKIL
ncbi:MAG: 3'-5' exonuclease, partial [Candidatus Altimarinota bacterium]